MLDVTLQKREPEKVEEKVKKPVYNWLFENSINTGKARLDISQQEFKYEKWRTNSSLSNFVDTIFYANQMNINYNVTDQMHYDYLFYSIRKSKRYGKKKTDQDRQNEKLAKEEQDNINLICDFYKYNKVKAKAALRVLTDEQLKQIKNKLQKVE